MKESECLFCQIASRQLETDLVYESDSAVAFHDINPKSPVHILIVPRKHIDSLAKVEDADGALMGELMLVAKKMAEKENLTKNGFRVVINTGGYAGQTVEHLHAHLMGGRAFSWPPG